MFGYFSNVPRMVPERKHQVFHDTRKKLMICSFFFENLKPGKWSLFIHILSNNNELV